MTAREQNDDVRVHWSVTLWGPRAADDPRHSIGGSGDTPDAAIQDLLFSLNQQHDLIGGFLEKARELRDRP